MLQPPIDSSDSRPDPSIFDPLDGRDRAQFHTELLDAVSQPIVVVDTDRTIIYWNRAAQTEYGWTPAEALGRSSVELMTRREEPEQTQEMVAALLRGESWSGDFEVTRRDGSALSVYVTNTPLFDEHGRLWAVIGVTVDASERRRLSAIVESSGDAIWGMTSDGLVSSWNGAAEELFGYAAREIVGQPASVLVPNELWDAEAAAPTRVLAGGSVEHLETTRLRKDGSSVDVRLTLSPTTNDRGAIVGVAQFAHDITERRESQRALTVSQQQLAEAQRIARVGSVEVDLVNGKISRTVEFCRILGVSDELQTSDHVLNNMLDPADRPSWLQAWNDVVGQGIGFDLGYRIVRPDGRKLWVRVRGVPELDADGTVVKVTGTLLDDTERIEAEQALRANERLYTAFLDNMPVGVYILTADGSPFYANRTATELLGARLPAETTANDLPGSYPVYRAGTDLLYPVAEQPIVRALAGGDGHRTDIEIHRADGVVPLEVWAKPVRDGNGMVTHAIGVFADITERSQAEAQARFRAHLLDIAGQAITATDAAGLITYWNRAAEALYGWKADEVAGRSLTQVVASDATDDQAEAILAAITAGQGWSGELDVQRRDGSWFPASIANTPVLDHAGAVVGLIVVSSDVTDRRALEDRVRQSQRLESLGQLAGGVAHDFNNLLNVILNYGAFVVEATTGEVREDAAEIIKAGDAARRLTRQLLTFARREQVKLQALDLNAVVDDVHGLLARSIGEDVHLIVRKSDILAINADRGHLEQILVNLAVNGRDAMPDGGTLTIETSVAEIDDAYVHLHPDAHPGRYVQLAVSDTGTGMSAEVAARAFEPFFTTKHEQSGTGLGLATIHGIVTNAGGTITMYSEVGLGTTIRVYFPIATTAAGDEWLDVPEKARGHGESVLVVEDHHAVRALTVRLLRRNGYDVVEADGPEDALRLAADRTFDLLLTDVIMPDMSGRALAERISLLNPTQPVLYMSGYSDGVLGPSRTLDPGVSLVQKPFTEFALLEAVDNALT